MKTNLVVRDGHYVVESQNQNSASKYDKLKAAFRSTDPKIKAMVARANAEFIQKSVGGTTHVDIPLANMSQQYKNSDFIGDNLLPIIPTAWRSGVYFTYGQRDQLAYPDDQLGPRATANEISKTRATANYSVKDYGLKDFLDLATAQNANAPLDEMADLIADVNNAIDFKREQRQAVLLTTPASYGANTVALASGVRWDTASGKPTADILAANAALWGGIGQTKKVAFCSLTVWNALVENADMRDIFKYTKGGLLQPEQFANYYGIDELWVGQARQDTANEGQAGVYGRIWPDVFGLIRVATNPGLRTASFGATFRWNGTKNTDQWFDQGVGVKGGYWGRVSVSDDYRIISPLSGYLIQTPVG